MCVYYVCALRHGFFRPISSLHFETTWWQRRFSRLSLLRGVLFLPAPYATDSLFAPVCCYRTHDVGFSRASWGVAAIKQRPELQVAEVLEAGTTGL